MSDNDQGESVLLIEVIEAESVTEPIRSRLDPALAISIPPHVTILFPFVRPEAIDARLLEKLRSLFAPFPPFRFRLDHVDFFERQVMWLAPEPHEPFQRLTEAAVARFPSFPPYEGRFATVVPHLTVGEGATSREFDDAARTLNEHLPLDAEATRVSLMVREANVVRWSTRAWFPLEGR